MGSNLSRQLCAFEMKMPPKLAASHGEDVREQAALC
jgi:hypothetical protein